MEKAIADEEDDFQWKIKSKRMVESGELAQIIEELQNRLGKPASTEEDVYVLVYGKKILATQYETYEQAEKSNDFEYYKGAARIARLTFINDEKTGMEGLFKILDNVKGE